MNNEILKDLNRVIEKYKDKAFCTGELNYVDMAKSCKLEIERLNNELENLEKLNNANYQSFIEVNNIINKLKKYIEESYKYNSKCLSTIFEARAFEDNKILEKLQELKGDGSNE